MKTSSNRLKIQRESPRRAFLNSSSHALASGVYAASVMLERVGKVFADELSREESMNPLVSKADRQLNWATFLKQCAPVLRSCTWIRRLPARRPTPLDCFDDVRARTSDIPRAKVARFGKLEPAVSFGVGYRGKTFFIVDGNSNRSLPCRLIAIQCERIARLASKAKRAYAISKSLDQAPESPRARPPRARTHNEVIAPGRINALSSLRDNTFIVSRTRKACARRTPELFQRLRNCVCALRLRGQACYARIGMAMRRQVGSRFELPLDYKEGFAAIAHPKADRRLQLSERANLCTRDVTGARRTIIEAIQWR